MKVDECGDSSARLVKIGLANKKRKTAVRRSYQIVLREETEEIREHLASGRKCLLPMVELIEGARMAIDELIDVLGRASVEAVLELSASLLRCLGTTNIIESPMSGVRLRTRRISRFTNSNMALRWAASAFLDTEESFRKISGYQDLWMLKAKLEEKGVDAKEGGA